MRYSDLPEWATKVGDWVGRYYATLGERPVRARISPGELMAQIPSEAPEEPEEMARIFSDFETLIPDAMTHWQHPRFFAYFNANASPASIVAEQIVNSMACNCFIWQTSPAATELEMCMIEWFRKAVGLTDRFSGLIHDSATTATLCAVLTMRERALNWRGLNEGLSHAPQIRIYASPENHSSIDKAARLSGIGQNHLVKVATDESLSMRPDSLREAIQRDINQGRRPAGLILCVGGTANGACDRIAECTRVAKEFDLYCHVDAAWAGAAMICPEFRDIWKGVEYADSIVINPHKWTGVQFDCSLQFLAEPKLQSKTLGLRPEYLETLGVNNVTNFNEFSIPLGRRFRALKLWFVLRSHGLSGLRQMIRNHVRWVEHLQTRFESDPDFEIVTSSPFALFTFAFTPSGRRSDSQTLGLLERVNDDGRIYLTQSRHQDRSVIRMTAGSMNCHEDDVMMVYDVVRELASAMN